MGYIKMIKPLYDSGFMDVKMKIINKEGIFSTYSFLRKNIMEIVKINASGQSSNASIKDSKKDIESLIKTKAFFKKMPKDELILFGMDGMTSRVYNAKEKSLFFNKANKLLMSNETIVSDGVKKISKRIKRPGSFVRRRNNIESSQAHNMIIDLFDKRIVSLTETVSSNDGRRKEMEDAKKNVIDSMTDFGDEKYLIKYVLIRINEDLGKYGSITGGSVVTDADILSWFQKLTISKEGYVKTIFGELIIDTNELLDILKEN